MAGMLFTKKTSYIHFYLFSIVSQFYKLERDDKSINCDVTFSMNFNVYKMHLSS